MGMRRKINKYLQIIVFFKRQKSLERCFKIVDYNICSCPFILGKEDSDPLLVRN